MVEVEITPESSTQEAEIRALLCAAFPTAFEADLVDRLRADGAAEIALVATERLAAEGARLVGHVLFSRLDAPMRALALAPVAVSADYRGKGIAARLIEAGLIEARRRGWDGVFVLGDPAYYARFGFTAAAAAPFTSPYAGPFFMALPLGEGAWLASGSVTHAPAFAALD